MNKLLIVYPHGLGDYLMATPSFRQYRKKNKNSIIHLAVQSLVYSSGILKNQTYFDAVFTIHRPWSSSNIQNGIAKVRFQINQLNILFRYDKIIYIEHVYDKDIHKVLQTAKTLNIDHLESLSYDVYYDKQSKSIARKLINKLKLNERRLCFVHLKSSDFAKNISRKKVKSLIPKEFENNTIYVGEDFDISKYNIGVSFALLDMAKFIIVVDSVFAHAADGLGKTINHHFISEKLDPFVKPLNSERLRVSNIQDVVWKRRLNSLINRSYLLKNNFLEIFFSCLRKEFLFVDKKFLAYVKYNNEIKRKTSGVFTIFKLRVFDLQYVINKIIIVYKKFNQRYIFSLENLPQFLNRVNWCKSDTEAFLKQILLKIDATFISSDDFHIFVAVKKDTENFYFKKTSIKSLQKVPLSMNYIYRIFNEYCALDENYKKS